MPSKLEDRVYREVKGTTYIGRDPITPELLDVLREQARYLETSQIYELLLATLKNEAFELALIQSKEWDNVQFAKALYHCSFVLENLVAKLGKR